MQGVCSDNVNISATSLRAITPQTPSARTTTHTTRTHNATHTHTAPYKPPAPSYNNNCSVREILNIKPLRPTLNKSLPTFYLYCNRRCTVARDE